MIRRLDELLLQRAMGYETRQQFIQDAIDAMVLEVEYGLAPGEPATHTTMRGDTPRRGGSKPEDKTPRDRVQSENEHPLTIEETKISPPVKGHTIAAGIAEVADGPQFGLHNRDYPSIWAASRLAQASRERPANAEEVLATLGEEAWRFAGRLRGLEDDIGVKLTALFPTNREKPQSATWAFLSFAIGSYRETDSGIRASGPLFAWSICQLEKRDRVICIGMTEEGYSFLNALAGMSLMLPHESEYANRFFHHLRRSAPADWLGFRRTIEGISKGFSRPDLVQHMHDSWPEWTQSVASTNTAGYVARSREWGLVEPKLRDRRYVLTGLGMDFVRMAGEE